MTRLWIMSDLHLEAVEFPEQFRPPRPEFDILVAAGDIWEGDTELAIRTVAQLAAGKPAVFVMGNHEYWDSEVQTALAAAMHQAAKFDITMLHGTQTIIGGIHFVGGTLWTDGKLSNLDAVPNRPTGELIDIASPAGVHRITFGDAAALHRRDKHILETLLADYRGDSPTVVVTHHPPHPFCLSPETRSARNAGIRASDLSTMIDAYRPALWVHGHLHERVDLSLNCGTRIICNPAGPAFTNLAFEDDCVVEV